MKKKRLLVVFLMGVVLAYSQVSCTYDYFVDESNYKIFVPEVALGTVKGCYVAVYDEAGMLVKARRADSASNDPRVALGLFNFHLSPGKYTAYCYANVHDIQVMGAGSAYNAFIAMKRAGSPAGKHDAYALPPEVVFQKLTPTIGNTFEQIVDTTALERYVGRITVRFKNIPVSLPAVSRVQLEATGVATRQFFGWDTITSRFTENDYIFDDTPVPPGTSGSNWEMDHYYFPSVPDQLTRLNIRFIGADGQLLNELPVEVIDTKTDRPLTLLHGRRIILEIDNYMVIGIGITEWDKDIKHSDREI